MTRPTEDIADDIVTALWAHAGRICVTQDGLAGWLNEKVTINDSPPESFDIVLEPLEEYDSEEVSADDLLKTRLRFRVTVENIPEEEDVDGSRYVRIPDELILQAKIINAQKAVEKTDEGQTVLDRSSVEFGLKVAQMLAEKVGSDAVR